MNDGGESVSVAVSDTMRRYFQDLQDRIDQCYHIAGIARKKGLDPSLEVEIPQALDLAARVEELVGPVGIAPKIREVTKQIGNRELVSLEIARFISNGKNYMFNTTEQALDQAIRTGLAILTEGVLVAPLEGIAEVKLGSNNDGSNYVDLYFAGPIRSAGGTGQAMSVLIADVVRRELQIDSYKPTDKEIERYKEEIPLYKRVQHLQYTPTGEEIHKIVSKCPICVNGEGTEDEEVTGNRDLPRVGTNRLRGGACLVIAEGLCLKAPKLLKHVSKLDLKGWEFLDDIVNKNKDKDDDTKEHNKDEIPVILPSTKYIGEVIAGRPVFSHPSRKGGFRLRYGRARTAGLASTAIHPAAMFLLDEFIAVGTQMKTERPGKATIGTPCSEIEPPIVLLNNGDLIEIHEAVPVDLTNIKQIVDVGEILVPYGEFLENNALLPESSYDYEWWIQELQRSLQILPEKITKETILKADELTKQQIKEVFGEEINLRQPTFEQAYQLSQTYHIPLHPYYNLFWHDITPSDIIDLATYIKTNGSIDENEKLQFPHTDHIKQILIELGALHSCHDRMILFDRYSSSFIQCLGYMRQEKKIIETERTRFLDEIDPEENTVMIISRLLGVSVRAKAPFRIGTRMGRPEKAAQRKMRPPPHVLFPLGNYGTNQRLFSKAAEHAMIEIAAGKRSCSNCGKTTYRLQCSCGTHTEPIEGRIEISEISINEELLHAKKTLKLRTIPTNIKGVQGTISKHKTPEPLEKGILRAKHDVTVFKDGTIRFDMTDAPITHFKPKETHVSIDKLKKLGYTTDIYDAPLEDNEQICELKIQDIIISKACAEYFIKVTNYIDELLVRFYEIDRFYNVRKMEDLIGHLAIGLAPHTSGGSLARIIGFTDSQVCFSHPFYHAAKRRNCYIGTQRLFLYDLDNNEYITDEIASIVEEHIQNLPSKRIDAFGTLKCDLPDSRNLFAYTLDRQSGKLVKKKVTCFIKGVTDDWVQIKTSTNREITVTPDHTIAVLNEGMLTVKKACDITKGDTVPLATHVPSEKPIDDINLVRSLRLLPFELLSNIKIRHAEDFFKKIVKNLSLDTVVEICEINYKKLNTLSKWYKSVPLLHFIKLCEHTSIGYDDLPSDALLGFRKDHVTIPVYIKDISSLFWVLGLYCAKGWSGSKNSSHKILFRICEPLLRDELVSKMKQVFSLDPHIVHSKIAFSSRLLYILFTQVWDAGLTTYEKKVPKVIYKGDRDAIQQYISAFFDSDGYFSVNPDTVTIYSESHTLLEGIATLLLREEIFGRFSKTEDCLPGKKVLKRYKELGKAPLTHELYHFELTGYDREKFTEFIRPISNIKRERATEMGSKNRSNIRRLIKYQQKYYPAVSYSDYTFDFVTDVNHSSVQNENTYCFDVEGGNLEDKAVYWHNQMIQIRCDGDEDGQMLLMDALLNFSHEYIPDKRGGKMDLPLILTIRLDPSEVDKEAHNVDTLYRYPLNLYEATLRHAHPKDLEKIMDTVSNRLGTPLQYEQFGFTHDTFDISAGPKISRYKTLNTMMEKMNAQLDLAAKIRAVYEADVAYKVIERHFLPDILGNLKAFSKQSVRCPTCNITYRRIPLSGVCRKCKGKLSLTVHEKSVKKYLDISKEIADRYHIPAYACQRIHLVEKSIDSLFSSDKVRKTKLTDFF